MTSISVAVMAHQKRESYVAKLVPRLGVGDDRVVWDRRDDRWETGRRAMMHHDPEADWHMVIQDDALVCRDLIAGLEQALDHVPRETIVSPFIGTVRPARQRIQQIADRARRSRDVSWVILNTLNWGVVVVVPVWTIPDMVAWADYKDVPYYDTRVGQYYWRQLGWPTWYTWPSLVDHRRGPSISGHGESVAHEFIGENASALEWDRSGQVLDYQTTGQKIPAQPRARQSQRTGTPQPRKGWTPQRKQQRITTREGTSS